MNGIASIICGLSLVGLVSGMCYGQTRPATTESLPPWAPGVSCREITAASLRPLSEAGIRCVQFGLADFMHLPAAERPPAARRIVEYLRAANIHLWSVHLPYDEGWDISALDPKERAAALDNLRQAVEVCKILRPTMAVIHPSFEPVYDKDRARRMTLAREALKTLTGEFRAVGVQLAVEELPRTCLGSNSDEILWLIDGIDGLGVCFDTNHLLREPIEDFIRKVGPRIVMIHASDFEGTNERHWMPGEGIIRWPALVQQLRDVGYTGPFLYETSKHRNGDPITPAQYMRFWEGLFTPAEAR